VNLVGALPREFELATVYTAGVSAAAAEPAVARRFVTLLADASTLAARTRAGFEFE
jgi:molybdate transport system substrate-binding protein